MHFNAKRGIARMSNRYDLRNG